MAVRFCVVTPASRSNPDADPLLTPDKGSPQGLRISFSFVLGFTPHCLRTTCDRWPMAPEPSPRRMDAETRPTKVPPTREQQAMTFHFRSIIALSILVIVLAACGTAVGAPTSPSQAPSPSQPAAPTVEPTVEPTAEPTVEPSETPA